MAATTTGRRATASADEEEKAEKFRLARSVWSCLTTTAGWEERGGFSNCWSETGHQRSSHFHGRLRSADRDEFKRRKARHAVLKNDSKDRLDEMRLQRARGTSPDELGCQEEEASEFSAVGDQEQGRVTDQEP